jgi:hypothetical protein
MEREVPAPHPGLARLQRLVGTWKVTGGTTGLVSYEWMDGGFFLLQRVDLEQGDRRLSGFEVIGPEQPGGAEPSAEIRSRFYDNLGHTSAYVYEIEGDTLTIWAGEKGSSSYYRGVFSIDGDTLTGRWVVPGHRGYESFARRVGPGTLP